MLSRQSLRHFLFSLVLITGVRAQAPVASADYVLQPLDLLQVRVFQEPDMDREVRISQDFVVTLPLIGRVELRGLTVRDAEQRIRDLYDRDFLVNPQINIIVLQYARRTVNVLGAVSGAGEIEFPREEGLTLLDAIARAGGFTRLADRRRIRLTRRMESGDLENFVINADELIDGNSPRVWTLQNNDLIFVPERVF
jgi:polysaccharide export outer membrane protein